MRGLYRKCDGSYIFVVDCSMSNFIENTPDRVHYYEVEHPEVLFNMEYSDFVCSGKEVLERADNVTGQESLYVQIKDMSAEEKTMTTRQLITELAKRKDSPLQDLSYDGFCNEVFCKEYVVGEPVAERQDPVFGKIPKGVTNIEGIYNTLEEAKDARWKKMQNDRLCIFRRSWIYEGQK